jgi:hypothetical protein
VAKGRDELNDLFKADKAEVTDANGAIEANKAIEAINAN